MNPDNDELIKQLGEAINRNAFLTAILQMKDDLIKVLTEEIDRLNQVK
jgi:hypothetical protein